MKFVIVALSFLILSTSNAQALVRHFVTFRYAAGVTEDQKKDVRARFLALQESCRRPDGTKYVLSIEQGLANSPEGADQKFEDGYLVTFATTTDRDYYVGRPFFKSFDPAHDAFKSFVGPLLDTGGAFVFDFVSTNNRSPN